MAAPAIAAPTRRQASTELSAVAAVILFGVAVVGLIAILLWSPWTAPSTLSTVDGARHYGAAYPLHGGLAGPSRVGQISTVDEWRFGAGYPLHGGLAGPSQVGTRSAIIAGRYGAGYPLHGGLAGPSQVGTLSAVDIAGHFGPGYPLHGGLAGPSRASTVSTVVQTPEGNVFAWPNRIGDGS